MIRKRLFAEFVGTATLVATVVGSGIMATNLSSDVGIQLLINTIATGWYASSKPVASGNSKAALAKNRRVEIYIK